MNLTYSTSQICSEPRRWCQTYLYFFLESISVLARSLPQFLTQPSSCIYKYLPLGLPPFFYLHPHLSLHSGTSRRHTHKNQCLSNMTHFIKHNFVYIYVLRPSSFQRRGWRETEDMEVPGRHTLPLYP